MRNLFFIVVLLATLVGCAIPKWGWVPADGGEGNQQQFYSDKAECLAYAHKEVPVPQFNNVTVEQNQNSGNAYGGNPATNVQRDLQSMSESRARQAQIQAQTAAIKSANSARESIFEACMGSRGWLWQRVQ